MLIAFWQKAADVHNNKIPVKTVMETNLNFILSSFDDWHPKIFLVSESCIKLTKFSFPCNKNSLPAQGRKTPSLASRVVLETQRFMW
jgi:hypothetical protein